MSNLSDLEIIEVMFIKNNVIFDKIFENDTIIISISDVGNKSEIIYSDMIFNLDGSFNCVDLYG